VARTDQLEIAVRGMAVAIARSSSAVSGTLPTSIRSGSGSESPFMACSIARALSIHCMSPLRARDSVDAPGDLAGFIQVTTLIDIV
jgi:hypothetical protein